MSKSIEPRGPKGSAPKSSDNISDSRFTNIQTDPRFRLPSKRKTHVQIDKRFASMLKDEAFSSTAKVDRYGRKLRKNKVKKDLEKFYRIEDENAKKSEDGERERSIEDEAVDRELENSDVQKKNIQYGEENSEDSESSSEDDESSDQDDAGDDDEVFGLLEGEEGKEGIPKGEISSRLAVVNLDWDNIRAADLMAVFHSFVPTSGQILKLAVYPSEFGKERMEQEEQEGPPKEMFAQKKPKTSTNMEADDESDMGDDYEDDEQIKQSIVRPDDGAEYSSSLLRRYQLSRLRYYYAVVVCSSPSVASAIYDTVDGTEYLTTANFFDLRYIPDETSFEDDMPRDECSSLPDGYRPNEFVTDALQHSKVKLTWDADDGARKEVQKRAFSGSRKDMDANDLRAYLGTDSEEEDDDVDGNNNINYNDDATRPVILDTISGIDGDDIAATPKQQPEKLSKKEVERQRMRALLGLSTEPEAQKPRADKATPVGDMQVTFTSGLSTTTDRAQKRSVFENEPEQEETTVEKYVRKEKERKARRKEKMKLKNSKNGLEADYMSDDEEGNNEAAIGNGQPEEEGEKGGEADLGFNDPFFTTATTDPPTTESNSARKADRRRRLAERSATEKHSAAPEISDIGPLLPHSSNPSTTIIDDDGYDDNDKNHSEIKHFNLTALARADKLNLKLPKKQHQKHKLTARDAEALEAKAQDDFQMDVADERFRQLYERADFAVDPSHPRYMPTEGMRRVLEEGRRRKRKESGKGGRGVGGEEDEEDDGLDGVVDGFDGGEGGKKEMKGKARGKRAREDIIGNDVEELVRKVKKQVES